MVRFLLALATAAIVLTSWATPAVAENLEVQLLWTHQAQFAGFYVADARGYYRREGLEVSLVPGGPGIAPLERLERGEVDVAVAWLPHALDARMRGADIVNIAQVFHGSAMSLACKTAAVRSIEDIAGQSIGVWNLGDETSVRLWLRRQGIPDTSVKLVPQAAHAADLIEGRVACATIMSYNEFWNLVRAGFQARDLIVVRFGEEGLGLLEDGLYVRRSALEDADFRRRLASFLRATVTGWREARLYPNEAIAALLELAPGADRDHQENMLETVLTLIPADGPFGLLALDEYERTVKILAEGGFRENTVHEAAREAWTHRIWRAADLAPSATLPPATQHYLQTAVRTQWFYVLDLIGTAAFGLAGFMRAERRRYNLWGAFVCTAVPAVGGGTLRDLLVGGTRHPPFILEDPSYLAVVLMVVAAGTIVTRLAPNIRETRAFSETLLVLDSVGLSVFAIVGAQVALIAGLDWYYVPLCAAITAAGGGLLLDVITARPPRAFSGGAPYEGVAIGGSLLFLLLLWVATRYEHEPGLVTAAIVIALLVTFTVRIVVIKFQIRSYRLVSRRSWKSSPRQTTTSS
ncbi:MAG: ABC transporter substrate-binding protein [Gammaproteobacteria bacterium]